jgi:nucleoside-diphosphate-sugar epimerase
MEKILVTGAAGYVGQEVVKQLVKLGKDVVSLDCTRASDLTPCIEADLTEAAGLEDALKGATFDTIMHIASLPGDTGDPQQMLRVNVQGCLNMLEVARKMSVQRFVLTSSISVYEWYPATPFNPPDYLPVDEKHPCRPKDMYSTSKRMQELLILTYFHEYHVPTTALRLAAVVGPGGRGGGRGWREFAEQLAGGEVVEVPHFSAEELCHYVDLRDVARMHIALGEHPKAVGEIFNCVGPRPTYGKEFIGILQRLSPGIRVEFGYPWSMAQGGKISFSHKKASDLLGFEPLYDIEASIESIADWVKAGGLQGNRAEMDHSFGGGVKAE